MTREKETIAHEDAWEKISDEDHLTELAIALVADAQFELVDPPMLAHAETCAACSHRVGLAAITSAEAAQSMSAIAELRLVEARNENPHRFPIKLVLAAFGIAFLGFLPSAKTTLVSVFEDLAQLPTTISLALQSSLSIAHAFSGTPIAAVVTFAGSSVLVLMGCIIAYGQRLVSPARGVST